MSRKAKSVGAVALLLLVGGVFLVGQYLGRRGPRPVEWLSQALGGRYMVDQEVKCANGKSLGWIKVDLNLTNGKLRVVRNDPGKWPACE